MGNPAIWWVGIIAFFASVIITIKNKDRKMLLVFTAIAFQYVPWMFVPRIIFIYHFFPVVPFMIILIAYMFKYITDNVHNSYSLVYSYMAIVLILFVMFYPVLSGFVVDKLYVEEYLRWFKNTWYF
jgi:dolichyl-phosphate-mannose--protein O-mannosyl transferase